VCPAADLCDKVFSGDVVREEDFIVSDAVKPDEITVAIICATFGLPLIWSSPTL
jgi:hypothetical protein